MIIIQQIMRIGKTSDHCIAHVVWHPHYHQYSRIIDFDRKMGIIRPMNVYLIRYVYYVVIKN